MSTPNLAVDYLNEPVAPTAFQQAGYIAVLRYLRATTAAQAQADFAAGLKIGMIDETAANEATFANGTADGIRAVSEAQSINVAAGAIIFVNIGDFAATAAQMPQIVSYYDAWAAEIRGAGFVPGGYGTAYIIQGLVAAGCQGPWWQNAMNDSGVPGNVVIPQASIYQRVAPTLSVPGAPPGSWDEDVLLASIPWWTATPAPPVPPAPPGGDMLNPVAVHGYFAALDGTPPPAGTAAFYVQEGTMVFRTNAAGGIAGSWPEPFPNGLLNVQATVGDRVPDAEMGVTLIVEQCNRNTYGAVVSAGGTPVVNGLVRLNISATGF